MSATSDPAAPFVAPDPSHLAELLPAYDIVGLIACGGMGAVYEAVQRTLDRTVAIKVLPREFGADTEFRESFQAEARAMARLNHPNLIGVFDSGEVDGMPYIVMEFVGGGSLYHAAGGKQVDAREVARIVAAVCDGLAHAHEHGILHRDIKPANILLDPYSRPKIGDFGLARPIDTREDASKTIYGSVHYTAPEVMNRPEAVDVRADIFSIGVVLHELLTGQVPAADPRPASMICHCDMRFDAIIRTATNPMPEMRYADVSVMARELHDLEHSLGQATQAVSLHAPPQVVKRGPAPVRRAGKPSYASSRSADNSGWLSTVLILGGVVLAAFLIIKYRGKLGLTPAPPPVPAEAPATPGK